MMLGIGILIALIGIYWAMQSFLILYKGGKWDDQRFLKGMDIHDQAKIQLGMDLGKPVTDMVVEFTKKKS